MLSHHLNQSDVLMGDMHAITATELIKLITDAILKRMLV